MSVPTTPDRGSAFDPHRPPDAGQIGQCIHCGFCLPTCPTYVLWGEEMDSPRGRIVLMRTGLEAGSAMAPMALHFDRCLGCMACVTACPSGVPYDRLIETVRPQVERHTKRPLSERAFRRLCFELFTHPGRLRAAAPLAPVVRRLASTKAMAGFPRLAAMFRLAPPSGLRSAWRRLPTHTFPSGPTGPSRDARPAVPGGDGHATGPGPEGERERSSDAARPAIPGGGAPAVRAGPGAERGRVGLLQGCVTRVFFAGVNEATVRVLAAEGFEVVAPRSPRCCGALQLHSGDEPSALALAKETIAAFEDCDVVVANAAGCGSAMRDYGHLLAGDPEWAERAERFAARVRDVTEVLAGVEPRAPRHPLPVTVAYHDACHLAHAQKVRLQPRALLAGIPQLKLVEPAEWELCCGSAGIYNLLQPDAAAELGRRKASNLAATDAQLIVAGNPGCTLQITQHLEAMGHPTPVRHTVELLDASIRNVRLTPRPRLFRRS